MFIPLGEPRPGPKQTPHSLCSELRSISLGTLLAQGLCPRGSACPLIKGIPPDAEAECMRMFTFRRVLFPLVTAALGLLFLASCGGTSSTTTGRPIVDPEPSGPTSPLPTDPTDPTAGLPDLTGAFSLNLTDKITYSGLAAIAAPIPLVTPVVGDPKVLLKVSQATPITGTIGIGFEHNPGFWWAELNSVEGTGQNTTNNFEIIFSDSQLTLRVSALKTTPNGNAFNSALLYRVRQANETQCLPSKCSVNWYGQTIDLPLASCFSSTAALEAYKASRVVECQNYMSTSQTQVKNLGTFSGNYTDIAVLP